MTPRPSSASRRRKTDGVCDLIYLLVIHSNRPSLKTTGSLFFPRATGAGKTRAIQQTEALCCLVGTFTWARLCVGTNFRV